jgi:hypothetical protein
MLITVFINLAALPRLHHNLTGVSRGYLRACRAVLILGVTLLGLSALWAGLDWWGHGFPHTNFSDFTDPFLMVGALLFIDVMRPPAWLNDRIEGLRVFAGAVEDRSEWSQPSER